MHNSNTFGSYKFGPMSTTELPTWLKQHWDEIASWRHWIHAHPELSNEEHETSAFIRRVLDQYQIPYAYPIAGTGIVAWVGEGGQTIAYRAELDALPLQEATDLPFASQYAGKMHACGHDVHMAILLALLVFLRQAGWSKPVRVVGIFQPSEERSPGGAERMIQEGVLDRWNIRYVLAQHVDPDLPMGTIGVRSGPFMASADEWEVVIRAPGGHIAQPHQSPNPILAAAELVQGLYAWQQHWHSPTEPFLLGVGAIKGGTAPNIIPNEVHLRGTMRTLNEDLRKHMLKVLPRWASQRSLPPLEIHWRWQPGGYPVLINDLHLHQLLTTTWRQHGWTVQEVPQRMGADDFAFWARERPGYLWRLGVKTPDLRGGLHTATLNIDDRAIYYGLQAAYQAINVLASS